MRWMPCFLLGAYSLVLAGCGMFSSPPPVPEAPPTPVVAFMMEHDSGESGTVDDPELGSGLRITMQDSFESASGEYCKRATMLAAGKQTEVLVICRKGNEPWVLAPRIWGG